MPTLGTDWRLSRRGGSLSCWWSVSNYSHHPVTLGSTSGGGGEFRENSLDRWHCFAFWFWILCSVKYCFSISHFLAFLYRCLNFGRRPLPNYKCQPPSDVILVDDHQAKCKTRFGILLKVYLRHHLFRSLQIIGLKVKVKYRFFICLSSKWQQPAIYWFKFFS